LVVEEELDTERSLVGELCKWDVGMLVTWNDLDRIG